jgi:hypothetical protein
MKSEMLKDVFPYASKLLFTLSEDGTEEAALNCLRSELETGGNVLVHLYYWARPAAFDCLTSSERIGLERLLCTAMDDTVRGVAESVVLFVARHAYRQTEKAKSQRTLGYEEGRAGKDCRPTSNDYLKGYWDGQKIRWLEAKANRAQSIS